ncbi:sec-independent protein translocase protein TatAd [bacterium BMS3Abin10]|nr:sec-independent protein translocase protein TatAd [bacterium BMS3Abin10]GBE39263.1 sec-independent protein translocase protein TatAd [bacterium BMS3Bbin08]
MQELILVFVVALFVFGPKKLPELSRALGRGVREMKRALRGVKDSFDEAESRIEESVSLETRPEVPEKEEKTEVPEPMKQVEKPGPDEEGPEEKKDDG